MWRCVEFEDLLPFDTFMACAVACKYRDPLYNNKEIFCIGPVTKDGKCAQIERSHARVGLAQQGWFPWREDDPLELSRFTGDFIEPGAYLKMMNGKTILQMCRVTHIWFHPVKNMEVCNTVLVRDGIDQSKPNREQTRFDLMLSGWMKATKVDIVKWNIQQSNSMAPTHKSLNPNPHSVFNT